MRWFDKFLFLLLYFSFHNRRKLKSLKFFNSSYSFLAALSSHSHNVKSIILFIYTIIRFTAAKWKGRKFSYLSYYLLMYFPNQVFLSHSYQIHLLFLHSHIFLTFIMRSEKQKKKDSDENLNVLILN